MRGRSGGRVGYYCCQVGPAHNASYSIMEVLPIKLIILFGVEYN